MGKVGGWVGGWVDGVPEGPMWRIRDPMPWRRGREEEKAVASPPTIIERVPLAAPSGPPLTGASR